MFTSLITVLSQTSSICDLLPYSFNTYCNIIFKLIPGSSRTSLFFRLPHNIPARISLPPPFPLQKLILCRVLSRAPPNHGHCKRVFHFSACRPNPTKSIIYTFSLSVIIFSTGGRKSVRKTVLMWRAYGPLN